MGPEDCRGTATEGVRGVGEGVRDTGGPGEGVSVCGREEEEVRELGAVVMDTREEVAVGSVATGWRMAGCLAAVAGGGCVGAGVGVMMASLASAAVTLMDWRRAMASSSLSCCMKARNSSHSSRPLRLASWERTRPVTACWV